MEYFMRAKNDVAAVYSRKTLKRLEGKTTMNKQNLQLNVAPRKGGRA